MQNDQQGNLLFLNDRKCIWLNNKHTKHIQFKICKDLIMQSCKFKNILSIRAVEIDTD